MPTTDGPGPFASLLRQYRIGASLSQDELAERAGLSRRGISDLERGQRRLPHPATVRRLAAGLGLDLTARAALLAAVRRPEPQSGARGAPGFKRLPESLSSPVGRERELAEVLRLLEHTRLLTLTGAGGVGKTTLAVSLAREWGKEGSDTVAFVDMAPLADPDAVPRTAAAQLGVPEQPGRPVLATLVDVLRSKGLLLVLDNCEHLVRACAILAHELLTACPDLRILATSREPLGTAGETAWRVPSLKLPEPPFRLERVEGAAAVRLFVERACAVLPAFELHAENAAAVAEVCKRLDGIPLALELAAARVPLLSVQQIAARLDDALGLLVAGRRLAPARQQTVRATLDWSYALLTEPERVLFERLSVFAGGWTLEAAEAVAGTDDLARQAVLALLGRLVDTSMVGVELGPDGLVRYRLLEALRQYGGECLAGRRSAEAIHGQHAAYFLALAEQTEPDFSSPRVMAAQARLEADHDNLRAALGWLLGQTDVDGAQRLAGALGRFWFFRGHVAEADAWLNRALALPGDDRPTPGRAKCMFGLSVLAMSRGEYATVERLALETRTFFHALGNAGQEAFCLFHLGQATTRLGKYDDARAHLEAGLALSRTARQGGAEANCLFSLAELAADLGDDDEARVWAEASMKRAMEIGQDRQIAVARRILGVLSIRQGDYTGAAALLDSSLATWRELGARWWIAETLIPVAQLATEQGDVGIARTRLTESVTLSQELGDRLRTAAALEGFAQVEVLAARHRLGLRLAGAAEALRDSIGVPLPPAEGSRLRRYLARAESALGKRAAEEARVEGRALAVQQAVDLALGGASVRTSRHGANRGRNVLTAREQAVAGLVAQGLTNRQIAEQLVIADGTAERHITNILSKLEMHARSQIAAWAVRRGIVLSEIRTEM